MAFRRYFFGDEWTSKCGIGELEILNLKLKIWILHSKRSNRHSLCAEALGMGPKYEKTVDNTGSNVVTLMCWSFFEQRMMVKPREGNPGNYVRFAFLQC